jgi:hypothetical protein
MADIVAAFVTLVGTFITFVNTYLVPADADSITILHVAIWTPVILGLLSLTVGMLRKMWGGKKT